MWALKELAVDVVRPPAVVAERDEEDDDEHALVDAQVRLGAHEGEVEVGGQRAGALPRLFFEVRQHPRLGPRPLDGAALADAHDADGEPPAVVPDYDLRDAARLAVRVHPAAQQLLRVRRPRRRVSQRRVQVSALPELHNRFSVSGFQFSARNGFRLSAFSFQKEPLTFLKTESRKLKAVSLSE